MSRISRRSFFGVAGAAAAVVAAGSVTGPAATRPGGFDDTAVRPARVPQTHEEHRAVVTGSGFGGGVSALRLTQAGVPVLMLERGRRWPTGPNADTFPSATAPDRRMVWHGSAPELFGRTMPVDPYVGLIEAVTGQNMTVLCAAGLGGGSLVYQGMTLQPERSVFETHFPAGLDYGLLEREYFPRVARMLSIATAPDALIETPNYAAPRAFAAQARRAGLPVEKIPMPIDWQYALDEVDGKMAPAYTSGAAFGINNGGKHTVDLTYVAQAEATGLLDVRTQHQVTDVERGSDGRWIVRVDRIDETGRILAHLVVTTDALIMAAGTMNTTRLLMRAQAHGTVPDLPDGLGADWGSNADRIYVWTDPAHGFGADQGGPVVYVSKNWDDPHTAHTVIQASVPALPLDTASTILVGYGASEGRGRFVYDHAADLAMLHWPHEGDHVLQTGHIEPTVRKIVGPDALLTDTNALMPSTWHPLGGAAMDRVCDLSGRVLGQPGLYVLDGALMPGNTAACNPSMTIAALAEHGIDRIIAEDVGTVF